MALMCKIDPPGQSYRRDSYSVRDGVAVWDYAQTSTLRDLNARETPHTDSACGVSARQLVAGLGRVFTPHDQATGTEEHQQ